MKFLSARRTLSAGIIAAASVAAFVAPSVASAALPGHCLGENTEGAGSSLQAEAQAVWVPGFSANKTAGCPGGPTIKYRSIGSGAGYKEWSKEHKFGTVGFVGTDNTVNLSEKEAVEKDVEEGKESKLLTIPVLQGAVAIVVNLPENCTANSKVAAGRLGLNQSTLEGIYQGTITKWQQITEVEGAGNTLTGAGCTPATDAITPIVRLDSSGTTHIFKKFLNLSYDKPMLSEDALEHTWAELGEGSLSTKWPSAANVKHAETETGPGLLKTVAKDPGSIGYANLADARNPANGGFTGQSASRFWVVLESSKKEKSSSKGVKITRKYEDPSKNKDVPAVDESNCKDTEFSNGKGTFPPPTVDSPWNEVTAKGESKSYALCGLTYDLVLTNYEAFTGGSAAEAQTVIDYEDYILSSKGGAKEIKLHDYTALPSQLLPEAQKGIELITG
ncbi:MAG: substrate-binding domain-containing protein [Solirubrobacteraceae bacterium]